MRRASREEKAEEIVFYCPKCLSLSIMKGKKIGDSGANILYCKDCNSTHVDVTTLDRYENLYIKRTGHHPLAPEPSKYDDLKDVYSEEAEELMTDSEALTNGLRVGEKINRKIDE